MPDKSSGAAQLATKLAGRRPFQLVYQKTETEKELSPW